MSGSDMPKTLCLSMIVRDEMANLERCLGAVADHIGCWVIGDTGSSDGTQDFIKRFFALRAIPGELHSFPFHDFAQARNAALDCAAASSLAYDYLLLADADMELVVEDDSFRERLEAPGYRLLQRAGSGSGLTYWNTRVVHRDAHARYHGVTHEHIHVPGSVKDLYGAWYRDHASGSNRAGKSERDIRLLESALAAEKDEFLRSRYTFYLGQSYREAGENEKALACFLRRADLGYWAEEIFMSLYSAGKVQEALGRPVDEIIATYLRASNTVPTRAEALHAASRLCRLHNQFADGYEYARRGLTIPLSANGLFVETWVYEHGLLEEFAVNAFHFGRYGDCLSACDRLLGEHGIPQQVHERIASYRELAHARLSASQQVSTHPDPIDLVPRPAADIEVEVVEGELLVYHPQQTRAVYLNPTAAVIWGLCDGKRTAREIIRVIGESYPEAITTLPEDVLVTLRELQENGVLVIG
jgi:hypothetical protein